MVDYGGEVKGKKHTYLVEHKLHVPKDGGMSDDIEIAATDETGQVRKKETYRTPIHFSNVQLKEWVERFKKDAENDFE
jgi:hypothetical protein